MALRKEQGHYHTYEDWLRIEHDKSMRVELIDGDIYMFASPTPRHQAVLGEIHGQLFVYLRKKRCKVYMGPIDVRLEKDTVVVPDAIVVCDPNKITKSSVNGAPDIVVEVLSPSTSQHDKLVKFELYRRSNVLEYWIADPVNNILTVHLLPHNDYIIYDKHSMLTTNILPGFEIDLSLVFYEDLNEDE